MRRNTTFEWSVVPSPMGRILLVSRPEGLCFLTMLNEQSSEEIASLMKKHFGSQAFFCQQANKEAARQLQEYFMGRRTYFTIPLAPMGSSFEKEVWKTLEKIPYGSTWSYSQVASFVGKDLAQRAVGTACGRNPIGIIIPCHRVVGESGSLGGYAGGLGRKIKLINFEQSGKLISATC
jgi:methylated-DNA-[protein]-cysteine S-methyltransferase